MSVYLSVAPPDGFTRWGDAEWERWLRAHPWESAELLCSRADWAVFLYQLRRHCPEGRKALEALLEQLIHERPLSSQEAEDLGKALQAARREMESLPAEATKEDRDQFASPADLDAKIAAARQRTGKEPTLADVWAPVLDRVEQVLANALRERRGIYFGNV